MIVITGASDGLGKELARVYKEAGKTVVNVSRNQCEFAEHNFLHDLTVTSEVAQAVQEISALAEPLDAVVNCAAIMSIQALGTITDDEVARVLDLNIKAAILLISGLAGRIQQDGSDIINVSSTVGTKGYEGQAAYGASKWAMRGFSENLRTEFKGKKPRVISFCVGGMRTNMGVKIGKPLTDPENWMDPRAIATFMKQILDLPKNAEVSEIIINRK